MERPNQYSFVFFLTVIIVFGLLSFAFCLAAEFKKSKRNDLRLVGKHCYLPRSSAYELGIAALICLSVAQVIGNLFTCKQFQTGEHTRGCKVIKPSVPCTLLVLSWISFGVAVILMSGATSMSRSQTPGEGWLDGECYLVKDGVYVGSAILVLLALGSTLGSGAIRIRRGQAEENRKVHAQVDE